METKNAEFTNFITKTVKECKKTSKQSDFAKKHQCLVKSEWFFLFNNNLLRKVSSYLYVESIVEYQFNKCWHPAWNALFLYFKNYTDTLYITSGPFFCLLWLCSKIFLIRGKSPYQIHVKSSRFPGRGFKCSIQR